MVVLGIAFVAALQNSGFTGVGSLRRFAEGLFAGTIPRWDSASLRPVRTFGLVCLTVLVSALLGSLATRRWNNLALLVYVRHSQRHWHCTGGRTGAGDRSRHEWMPDLFQRDILGKWSIPGKPAEFALLPP